MMHLARYRNSPDLRLACHHRPTSTRESVATICRKLLWEAPVFCTLGTLDCVHSISPSIANAAGATGKAGLPHHHQSPNWRCKCSTCPCRRLRHRSRRAQGRKPGVDSFVVRLSLFSACCHLVGQTEMLVNPFANDSMDLFHRVHIATVDVEEPPDSICGPCSPEIAGSRP